MNPDAAHEATPDSEQLDPHAIATPLGYPLGSTGFAATGARFQQSVADVAEQLALPRNNVAHDYWIVRGLHGIHEAIPVDGEIVFPPIKPGRPQRRIGAWGFAGGTALSAAWRITERYSQDIDGLLFLDNDGLSKHVVEKACGQIAHAVCDACESVHHETHGRNVKATKIDLEGHPEYLTMETVPQHGLDAAMIAPQVVHSFIGTHADDELIEEFPELGGFTVPCVHPKLTAISKLDALHRRAARGDMRGLVMRGRDLYDLWAIAQHQDHADDVRSSVADLWEAAAGHLRDAVARPEDGYAHSPALQVGTEANEALRHGYEQSTDATVWGYTPQFEDAVEAARTLDPA